MRAEGHFLGMLREDHVARLRTLSRSVTFSAGSRILNENRGAERFWVVRTGHLTMQQAHDRLRDHAARTGQHTIRLDYALVHGDLSTRDMLQPKR